MTTIAIVGAGLAGVTAAQTLRESGSDARIVLVSDDEHAPYDHPPLSKAVLAGDDPAEKALLHEASWYAEHDIELVLGAEATTLDTAAHTLTLDTGTEITWDQLLLAPGSTVRRLDVPGADLPHVHYLRTMAQSTALRDRLAEHGQVVIIGAGWIGLEVAAAARAHGCEVHVVDPLATPLERVVGPRIGQWFADVHTAHDVTFHLGEGVEEILEDGVRLSSGTVLPATTVVVGIGVLPRTDLAEAAGLEVDHGIVCDGALRTSAPDVWAAGDAASWDHPRFGRVRLEHWSNAKDSGAAAARSMLGEEVTYDPVPSFFSDQYDVGLEYAGHVPRGVEPEVVLRGDPATNEFLAFWLDGDRVLAGMHVNTWGALDEIEPLIGTTVDRDALPG